MTRELERVPLAVVPLVIVVQWYFEQTWSERPPRAEQNRYDEHDGRAKTRKHEQKPSPINTETDLFTYIIYEASKYLIVQLPLVPVRYPQLVTNCPMVMFMSFCIWKVEASMQSTLASRLG